MKQLLLMLLLVTLFTMSAGAQEKQMLTADSLVIFKFLPGQDMFYIPYNGNGAELDRLHRLVDTYREEIISGSVLIHVDGYSSSEGSPTNNIRMAALRSNRVKTELILHGGLKETHFVTRNYSKSYEGQRNVVTLCPTGIFPQEQPLCPADISPQLRGEVEEPEEPEEMVEAEPSAGEPGPGASPEPGPDASLLPPASEPGCSASLPPPASEPGCSASLPLPLPRGYEFGVRTNLLYDLFLFPTFGVEWRASASVGVKLDVGFSLWGSESGPLQKGVLVNPEVRWYLGQAKRFYVGASANYVDYNVYNFALTGLVLGKTGYQGSLWNAGLTAGYQLNISRRFLLDFNLGMGYTSAEYDSFKVINKRRVSKERDRMEKFFGPTQAGVSLVWMIGE